MSNEYNDNLENDLEEENKVIETIITDFSQSIEIFNQSLRKELNNISNEEKYIADRELILEYKPTDEDNLNKIPNLSREFINIYKNQITHLVLDMVSQFTKLYPQMNVITTDTRIAMKNVLLRNVYVSEKNELLDIDKMENILPNGETKKLNLKIFVNGIFDGKTQQLIEGKFKSEFILDKSIISNDTMFNNQNEFISLNGRSNLYISAYKIEGKIKNEDRNMKINAPLIFIPIVILDEEEHYAIYFDEKRKIKMNEDVIVAYNTIHKKNTIINNNIFNILLNNQINPEYSLKVIEELFISNELEINNNSGDNVFTISDSISIGAMKVFNSATHIDLDKILHNGFITDNIIQMFSTIDPEFKQTAIKGTIDETIQTRIDDLKSEGKYEVSPITKLNYPQEQALKNLNVYDNIVIQGPPGTGKTEAIVSIISDSILRNKKILVSSEKKVALDVVYSRLKELAKYSIILTNIEETSKFYDQLQFMLEQAMNDKANQSNSSLIMSDNEIMFRRNETRMQIVEFIKTYEEIFIYLRTNEIGKTFSHLYKYHAIHRTLIPQIKTILEESNLLNIIKLNKLFSPRLYDVLYMLNEKFSYKKENTEFDLDKAVIASYPFLITHTRKYITTNRVANVLEQIQDMSEDMLFDENGFTLKTKSIL